MHLSSFLISVNNGNSGNTFAAAADGRGTLKRVASEIATCGI